MRDGTRSNDDLRALAALAASSGTLPRLVAAESFVALLNVGGVACAIAGVRAGGAWVPVSLLLILVELVALLPLLVGTHWATVLHGRGSRRY